MKLDVHTTPGYSVIIENGVINRCGEVIKNLVRPGAKAMIVSETNVFPLYGGRVESSLKNAGIKTNRYLFDAGELSKNIRTVGMIYQALAENNYTRSDIIVTLGGGVAGDMGGFAAATYLRGVNFVQIPTSLLAQVDASVGGKTGIDLPFGKNLVGAFHQPLAVLTDPTVLKTLPRFYLNDGMGEVVKYGCISDAELFAELEQGTDLHDLERVIGRCVASKVRFVEADTKDTGERMVLNFGHTFGHALEKLHDFKDLPHGEAVGIGMVIATDIGEKLGITPKGTKERIQAVLEKYVLPTSHTFTKEELVAATALDKKSDGNQLNLILLDKIGHAVIFPTDRKQILDVL